MRKLPVLLLTLPLSAGIQAQSDSTDVALEELIVTATRRETSLQDTPLSVSVFTGEMMDALNINNPLNYEALVPSLSYQAEPNRISIRGVGRFSNTMGTNPGVGIYTDGIYSSEAASLYSTPMNTDRTEILRGPQGTLYGRNTTGGAINVITRRPTEEFHGDFRVKIGDEDYRQYSALVSGPVNDALRYKLYAVDTAQDGLQRNLNGRDMRSTDATYYEGQLEWDITENLQAWIKYSEYSYELVPDATRHADPYDCVNYWVSLSLSSQYQECLEGGVNPSVKDPWTVSRNTPGTSDVDVSAFTARLTYDMEQASLMYLYGNIDSESDRVGHDYDGTPNEFSVLLDIGQYQDQQSHELHLVSSWDKQWQYLLGFFYFEDENEQPYTIRSQDYPRIETLTHDFATFWDNPDQILYFQNGIFDNESWAIFGEVDIDLSDKWVLTLGARYSDDEFNGSEVQLQYYDMLQEGFPFAFDASQAHFAGDPSRYTDSIDATYKENYTNTTGKVTASYRPRDGHLFWGTLSNGYKMGGVRLGSLEKFYATDAGVPSDGTFDQEDLVMLEFGWKGDLLDRRLQTEVVAFGYEYDDMQRERSHRGPPPGNITLTEVINVDTRMYGLELSALYLVTDRLRSILTGSYNHSEISEDAYFVSWTYGERDAEGTVIPDNVEGNQLTLTPEWKASLALQYSLPTDIGLFTFGGTYAYVGKRYFDLTNFDSADSYTRLDLQASWSSNSGRYRILTTVNNATDEEVYNTHGCTAPPNGVYGTESWIIRCGGSLMDQRFWATEFSLHF